MILKKTLTTAAVVLIAVLTGAVAGAIVALAKDLPQIRMLENYSPSAVSRIYSADGSLLASLYIEKRHPVSIDNVPEMLKTALLTTEDRQFYRHNGLDLKGIARAIATNIRRGEYAEGASTLTQQLAKTLFLSPEKSLARKLREAFLAFQLERRYTKDEILELYLNQVYFGSGTYGVQMAADKFFGKSVANVDLAEAAMLAAMPRAPSVYSPLVNPDLAIQRRNVVLAQMRNTGAISGETFESAARKAYTAPEPSPDAKKAPYFVDYVARNLEKTLGSATLYKGGLTIRTTLDPGVQQAAEEAVENGLETLSRRMAAKGISNPDPQGALVAIDVKTGKILAMTGGRDYRKTQFNRAVDAYRQPGSAFKPIVYAHAIEQGYTQASLLLDAPVSYNGWQPENFSGSWEGEITLRKALADSVNTTAARLLQATGPSAVIDFARTCGITAPLAPYPSLALGTFELSLLELTSAYTVFANRGTHIRPYGVTAVSDPDGRVIWENRVEKTFAMSPAGAAVMTDALRAAVNEGTGRGAGDVGRLVAGKTGTTSEYRDALFAGFSPNIAAGVWVGRDDSNTLGVFETGGRAALPIWEQFMAEALKDRPPAFFDFPENIVEIRINPITGNRVYDNSGVAARFRKNLLPK